jgi:cellulose synthase/poly-beta-1,6-N-acetylglucosamine synthase-like glycosyltransferase
LNEGKYIERTLKALRGQDYKGRYEIIVVDGRSKDNTVKIARKYADKVILTKRRGIAIQRNAGAKIAGGEILLFIDADTMLLFNALSEMSKAFKNKRVVGATCPIIPLTPKLEFFFFFWLFNRYAKSSIQRKRARVAGACCAYRKKVFEKIGGFNERLETYEDLDLSERISKFGKIAFIENTLALTSVRRLKAWGIRKAAGKYIISHFKYLLTGKGMKIKEYKPIR